MENDCMTTMQRILVQLLPILLLLFLVVPGPAHPPKAADNIVSHWWYPFGNPGGTSQNNAPTASQTIEDIQVKWKTDRLKNSPVLLVGAIRTPDDENYQQVVGLEEGTKGIVILGHNGFIEHTFTIPQSTVVSLRLTGLFDTLAQTVTPTSRPNTIGIGVEQRVTSETDRPFGWFVNGNGSTVFRTGLRGSEVTRVARFAAPENRIVTILPVALYKPEGEINPRGIAIVTQDQFIASETGGQPDQMINSLSRYTLTRQDEFRYAVIYGLPHFLAPKLHAFPPALFMNDDDSLFMSLSTQRYDNINPAISIATGGGFQATLSNATSPYPFRMSLPLSTRERPDRIVNEQALISGAEAVQSFYAQLIVTQSDNAQEVTPARFFASVDPPNDSSLNRILFTVTNDQDPTVSFNNDNRTGQKGWYIITADVDGSAPGFPQATDREILVNNPGSEILTTARPTGSDMNGQNWLYVFRWNLAEPIGTSPFNYFTRQLVSGRVVAAGDLVADSENRQEILLAHRDTLFILQMKPYSRAEDFLNPIERENAPFFYLDTFAFDSDIVSVAIADLEGDGENDIVVSTKESTYALGKVEANPFPFASDPDPFNQEYCPKDSLTVAWERNVGGENSELEVIVIGQGAEIPYTGPLVNDEVRFALADLSTSPQPGNYRIVVRNARFPYIADTSESFMIAQGSVSDLGFRNIQPYATGDVLIDTVSLYCLDSVKLQQRLGDGNWFDVQDTITKLDERTVRIAVPLPCPEIDGCGDREPQELQFRIVSPVGASAPRSAMLTVRPSRLEIDTGLSRKRLLQWNEAEFPCDDLMFMISNDRGKNWLDVGVTRTSTERLRLDIPDDFSDTVYVCTQCVDARECNYALKTFRVSKILLENYVYPNPFDPDVPGPNSSGAEIVYVLDQPGNVTITIYDASREVVRQIVRSEGRKAGINRGDSWDGKNSLGENVANGTYICLILSDNGEQIILPIVIIKRQ